MPARRPGQRSRTRSQPPDDASARGAPGRPVSPPAGGRRLAGQRAGVTAESILAAANAIADAEGLEQVTMRRVAAVLGVAPNALYTYFPSKVGLLDAMLDRVLAGVAAELLAADADRETDDRWEVELAELMTMSRRALLAHPALVPLFLSRPGGPHALRLGERALQLLGRGGVHGARAVQALRALLVYTLGFAALEVPRLTDPAGPQREADALARIEALPASQFPATRAAARHLATHPGDADFHRGLTWLLEGIAGAS